LLQAVVTWQGAAIYLIKADLSPLQSPPHQGDTVIGLGFVQDITDVVVYGALANFELDSDVVVGETRCNQLDHLQFSIRQDGLDWAAMVRHIRTITLHIYLPQLYAGLGGILEGMIRSVMTLG
jgi:hypothetical protein